MFLTHLVVPILLTLLLPLGCYHALLFIHVALISLMGIKFLSTKRYWILIACLAVLPKFIFTSLLDNWHFCLESCKRVGTGLLNFAISGSFFFITASSLDCVPLRTMSPESLLVPSELFLVPSSLLC